MAREWTAEQQKAMHLTGGGILVSAAAGSGKTAVLVERIITRITDPEHPVPADKLLVATFTNAAAAEMRSRVDLRLRELLAENPGDSFLERQLLLLQKAKICTIDAFFSSLVRENFERLGISPSLRIGEDSELSDLRAGAMDTALERCYAQGTPEFLAAAEYFGERDDRALSEEALRLYDKTRSLPRPERWFAAQDAAYGDDASPEESPWGRRLLTQAASLFRDALRINRQISGLLQWDDNLLKGYGNAIQADEALFSAAHELAVKGSWDALCHFLTQNKLGPIGRAPKGTDEEGKTKVQLLRNLCKDLWDKAGECLPSTAGEFAQDKAKLLPVIRGVFQLCRAFAGEYAAAKEEASLADFPDFSVLAFNLCVAEDGRPTEFAKALSKNYEEILLDEYQDTNRLQDEIFKAISRNGENLFYVGDLKQSIYRFRSADPTVFAEKQARFSEEGDFPALLRLSRNFRSREGVLDAVNCVFSQIMSEEAGGVFYGASEAVHAGAVYPERPGGCLKVQLLDMKTADTEDSRVITEARYTARQIASLLREGYPVAENGQLRPCRPSDMAILLRSLKGTESLFCEALQAEGIDAQVSSAEGYFTSREVLSMISLLQALDNPLQDIPLAAVLLSPLGGFRCGQLAQLRLDHPDERLYPALLLEAPRNPQAAAFLSLLQNLREKAAVKRVRALIQYIYDSTDFLEIMAGSAAGREANLKLLLQYAGEYEKSGRGELSGFVDYIRRVMERKEDFQVANPLSSESGSVRIMSVHKSKGLEFPIVILANCSKAFNLADLKRPAIYHPAMGYGLEVVDRHTLQKYPTIPWAAVRLKEQADTAAEEIRLLYVAMTRARELLVLNISERNLGKTLQSLAAMLQGTAPLEPGSVLRMGSWSQWLLAALLRHPDFAPVRDLYGIDAEVRDEPFRLELTEHILTEGEGEFVEPELPAPPPNPDLVEKLAAQCGWQYPEWERTKIPSKLAVTDIVRKEEEESGHLTLPEPSFCSPSGFSAAQKGIIFHKALQFADYAAARDDPAAELRRLTEAKYLTPEEAESISLTAFGQLFRSETMARILAADKVWREYRFFDTVPASRAGYDGDAAILIQGVADCLFEEDGAGVLLDYKTDYASPEELKERYSTQLSLYRKALAPLFPKGIKECILYSLTNNCPILVE